MKEFGGRIAVVTGGGTGMGRELCLALAREGCHVATCDVSEADMAVTRERCEREAPAGTRISTHRCDVSDEAQVVAFADAVRAAHDTDHVHVLFNNAGIGGGGSFVADDREQWDRTFAVCWNGVYYCARAFLPLLMAADAGHIVNTSSVNGLWASLGPATPHTAYSAAKFAVRGFTEALITDLRLNAPHVKCSVVMPGHIGTRIVANSGRVLGRAPEDLSAEDMAALRERLVAMGLPVNNLSDDELRALMHARAQEFETSAPTTAARAAEIILDGVRAGRWRILVGEDAAVLDALVRAQPEEAYEPAFVERLTAEGHMTGLLATAGGPGQAPEHSAGTA